MIGGKSQKENFVSNPGDEVWGLNTCRFAWADGYWTRFFNLHTYENLRRYNYDIERNVQWLIARPMVRFYTIDSWPELVNDPRSYIFDRRTIENGLPRPVRHGYHCGSFDWMIAFALTMPKVSKVVLHGVSLLIEAGEPISARACLEYWCGVAEGLGLDVECAPDCDLFAFYHLVKSNMVYGYDDTPIYEDRTKTAVPGEAPYKVPDPVQ